MPATKRKLSTIDLEVLKAYMDANMVCTEAAKSLYMSSSNIDYHLNQIKHYSGLNPKNFYDLVKLMEVVE